jgi:hypothetical protein
MPIIRKDKDRAFDPLVLGSTLIEPSTQTRNLGFIFNRSLTTENHLSHVKRSTFYQLRRIDSLKHCVSFQHREILVHAFITSRLDFCNSLFYGGTQAGFKAFQSIFSAAAKSLCGVSRRAESNIILQQLHWLPIKARVLFKLAVFGYKILHGSAPEYFIPIRIVHNNRVTRSANAPLLTSDQFLSTKRLLTFGSRSCFYSICTVFNSLPPEIRACDNFSTFKSKLKTHLFIQSQ